MKMTAFVIIILATVLVAWMVSEVALTLRDTVDMLKR